MSKIAQRIVTGLITSISLIPSVASVFIMTSLIAVTVILRYFFNAGLVIADEYSGYMVVLITLVGASWVQKKGHHVTIGTVTERLPPRVRKWWEAVVSIAGLGVAIFFAILTSIKTLDAWLAGSYASLPTETPLGPVYLIMPVGFSIWALQLLVDSVGKIKAASSK